MKIANTEQIGSPSLMHPTVITCGGGESLSQFLYYQMMCILYLVRVFWGGFIACLFSLFGVKNFVTFLLVKIQTIFSVLRVVAVSPSHNLPFLGCLFDFARVNTSLFGLLKQIRIVCRDVTPHKYLLGS